MTANKRKRDRDEEQQLEEQPQAAVAEPEQKKKPPNNAPGIICSAIEKIVELENYMNRVAEGNDDSDDNDDYSSDYSDLSESGRFDANSTHSDDPVISGGGETKFNPEIVGFAICAQETMNFLRKEGFSEDNPLIRSMQERLLVQLQEYQLTLNGASHSRK